MLCRSGLEVAEVLRPSLPPTPGFPLAAKPDELRPRAGHGPGALSRSRDLITSNGSRRRGSGDLHPTPNASDEGLPRPCVA